MHRQPHVPRNALPHVGDLMYWYRTETKGIQRWILDAGRLRDLQGGSELIEQLTSTACVLAKRAGGSVIQAAAGGMSATFPTREALARFASEWPMRAAYWAPGLRVVQAWIEQTEGMSDEAATGAVFSAVASARNRPHPEFPEAGPWLKRAARTGGLAVRATRGSDTDQDRAAVARAHHRDPKQSSDQFGSVVGVIHIDGTGVGARFKQNASSADALRGFSERLAAATAAATAAAAEAVETRGALRLIVAGGDDVTAIVSAECATAYVRAWIEAFERSTELRAGAGIVFCSANFPFAQAYDLAEELCADSKRRSDGLSRVAIRRITSALQSEDFAVRPWTLVELAAVEKAIDSVGRGADKVARGPLRTWLTRHGRGEADAEQLWARIREVAHQSALIQLSKCAGDAHASLADPTERFGFLRDVLSIAAATRGET